MFASTKRRFNSSIMSKRIEAKKMKIAHQVHDVHLGKKETNRNHFENIPIELFYRIISLLGATSSDLITLSKVNLRYRSIMNAIGHGMLKRAEGVFRCNVWRSSSSHITAFVHLTRDCFAAQHRIEKLHRILKKDLNKEFTSSEIDDILDFCLNSFDKKCSKHQEKELMFLFGKFSSKVFIASKKSFGKRLTFNEKLQKKAALVMANAMKKRMNIRKLSRN